MFSLPRKSRNHGFQLIFIVVVIAAAFATASSFVFLVFQAFTHDAVIGDLTLRLSEFRNFANQVDPIDADPKLGYPIWAYITTLPLFITTNSKFILTSFVLLQILCLVSSGAILLKHNPSSLSYPLRILIIVGSMPWYALRYQATYMNYGLIIVIGLLLFINSRSIILRTAGIVIAMIKPALCFPVIFLSPWLHGLKIIFFAFAFIIMESIVAATWLHQNILTAIARPFTRYIPVNDSDLSEWFLSGDYGILSKLVRSNLLSERLAVISLLLLMSFIIAIIAKTKFLNSRNAATLVFLLIPLVSFHRYHDVVLIWPALASIVFDFLSADGWRKWLSTLPLLWALHYQGAGSGSLYSIAILLIIWVLYSPSFNGQSNPSVY